MAELTDVSIDGWNITGLIPGSSRSVGAGAIACVDPDVAPPSPALLQGTLTISILGHDIEPDIDADGILPEDVDAELIEGQVSLYIDAGTRCLDDSGSPLTYISIVKDPTHLSPTATASCSLSSSCGRAARGSVHRCSWVSPMMRKTYRMDAMLLTLQ